jgi:hypothetical protein
VIEKILAFIQQFWAHLIWWAVVEQEQLAFKRVWGKHGEELPPGRHWKMPIRTVIEKDDGRSFPYQCEPQSLTTTDDVECVVQLAFTAQVTDIRLYWSKCFNGRTELQDVASVECGRAVRALTWADVKGAKALQQVSRRLRAAAKEWGMTVSDVEFISCVRAGSHRLWQTQTTAAGQE